jgi:hypothetical protein
VCAVRDSVPDARTGRGRCAVDAGFGEAQQLTERLSARLMQSGAKGHLHRFQIHAASLPALGKDAARQRGYFARDLGVDRFGGFFSSGVSVSSTGRVRQIFSLTSTKDRSNWRYWRKVAVSLSVLRWSAGVAKLSVTDLPFTLKVNRGCGR